MPTDLAPRPVTSAAVNPATLSKVVLGTVVLVSAIAPLATDMYVPAFP